MIALEQRLPVPFCQLHGLVGLWDMLPFVTDEFYKIITELRDIRGTLGRPRNDSISDEVYYMVHFATCERVNSLLIALKPHLEALGAKIAIQAIDEHAIYLIRGAVFAEDGLFAALDDIDTQIKRELKSVTAFVLSPSEQRLYEPKEPLFGMEVDSKFKRKARREIDAAGKCLALQCYTACVFHLMRTVEVAIESIRTCLELPVPKKGQHKAWGAALDLFRKEIESRESLGYRHQWNSMADKKFFDEVYMLLMAIKDGCRDDTMHIESDYNEQEAEHLFALTKGFMRKVASRMDEDSLPLA